VTKSVLSEPQRLQARTNHTARTPALERHMPESGVGRLFFCLIGVARRVVKAQGVYMPQHDLLPARPSFFSFPVGAVVSSSDIPIFGVSFDH
jgi:hypothetical protein